MSVRAAAREVLLQTAAEKVKGGTSFEGYALKGIWDIVRAQQKKTADLATIYSKTATTTADVPDINITARDRSIARFQKSGRYYGITLDFALAKNPDPILKNVPSPALTAQEKLDWGVGFGSPLVNPKKNCIYVVRATISQLGGEPPFGGYYLHWISPTGWLRADGLGSHMYVECSSNPLLVARKYRSPLTAVTNAVFVVNVLAFYP
jgi:hypothetical protein